MEKIEKLLANLDKPEINNAFRENSRRRLVSYAKNETANELFIVKVLKEILNPLKVSLYLKNQVRARLMNLKRKKTFWEVLWEVFHDSFTRILASWTIASLFFVNIIWFNTTSADIESQLFAIEWEVYIQHLWENWKKISSNEILEIWDKIKTWKESIAEIYFYDNSVSRIAENTRIWIANLTTNIFEIKPTVLKLENWRIWNQVFPSKWWFKVETDDASANTKEWIFDVKQLKESDETEVQVISQPIEIKTHNWSKFNYSKVYAWTWIRSWKDWIVKEELKKDDWTESNQKKDIEHRENIVKKVEKIQIEKSKNFKIWEWNEKMFAETVNFFQKIKIHFYNKNTEKISELKKNILTNFEKSDEIFKSEILNFLNWERQKLKIFLPWDNLYEYKLFVSEISLNLDKNWTTTWDIKIDRLNEAHELLNTKDEDKLLIVLENLSKIKKNSELQTEAKNWEDKIKFENNLKNKLSKSNDELFLLQSLENSEISKAVKEKIKSQKIILAKEIKEIAWILTKDEKIQEQIAKTNNHIATQNSKRVANYLSRINKFKSENWQKNTLHWILEEIPNSKENISLLYSLRAKVDWELSFAVSQKIIKVRRSVK